LKIWFSSPENIMREPKPNICFKDAQLKTSVGLQSFKNQTITTRKKLPDICWTAKLHTPNPLIAMTIPMMPDSPLETRLTLVSALKLISFSRIVVGTRLKELITMVREKARVSGASIG